MIVDESPDQFSARMSRYADGLRRARGRSEMPAAPLPGHPPHQIVVWGNERATDDLSPTPTTQAPGPRHRPFAIVLGQAACFGSTLLALLVYELLAAQVAVVVLIVAVGGGLVAVARRMPLALWCTLGIVIGGAIGRWS